jgi:CHAT domain-containing protein
MLPFAALRNARGQYLIERYTLHYIPAISLLGFTQTMKKAKQASPSYLLIADPSGTPRGEGGRALPTLAGARREVATVARLLLPSEVKLLEGPQATERQVADLAGHSTVIHFATHGIIRDDQPFDSYLALGGSGWNLKQDGHLTAQKIYGLDLHADLVFLSACRSGLGQVSGDGMAGLTRAFLYAGTPSVIATLWDVADEPTYRLVGAFYRSWLNGSDKARALRSAQLRLLGELRRGQVRLHTGAGEFALPEDPVFWASFVLQGEP